MRESRPPLGLPARAVCSVCYIITRGSRDRFVRLLEKIRLSAAEVSSICRPFSHSGLARISRLVAKSRKRISTGDARFCRSRCPVTTRYHLFLTLALRYLQRKLDYSCVFHSTCSGKGRARAVPLALCACILFVCVCVCMFLLFLLSSLFVGRVA